MDWAALILWVLTAGGGFVLLSIWLRNGGMSQTGGGRIRPAVILTHFALAATGLVLWIIYVANDSSTLAWIAFVLLLIVALIGFAMLGLWLSQRNRRDTAPAEQRFPVPIVGLHGVLAATTLVLVFLAAVGVGS
jgi:manganese efflux pump family protein